jgi:transcriptional regulator with XRE-family HTH domain
VPGQHEALKAVIRARRSIVGITSDSDLATRAGVHLETLQNWMYGKTTPRPHQLSKVAKVLDIPMADLAAVYEGRDILPPPLQDAIRELVEELRLSRAQQHEATLALLRAIGAWSDPSLERRGTPADRRPAVGGDSRPSSRP